MNPRAKRHVVVGAGVAGLAIAYRLAASGGEVVVFDESTPGSGTTRAATGSLTPWSDEHSCEDTRRLAQASVEMYPKWIDELGKFSGLSVDFDQSGLLEIAFDEGHATNMRRRAGELRTMGARVALLSNEEALEKEPHVNPSMLQALYFLDEPYLDTSQLFSSLLAAALRVGCIVRDHERVVEVLREDGRLGIRTTLGSTHADTLIIATGCKTTGIGGIKAIPIESCRGEVLEVRGPPGYLHRHIYSGVGFITPRRDGRLLIGATYDNHVPGEDDNRDTISVRTAMQHLSAATKMVPSISTFQISRMWKGWRPRSPDGQPLIGKWGAENIFIANGLYGLGVTLAPALANLMGRIVLEDGTPPKALDSSRYIHSPSGEAGMGVLG